MNYKLHISSEEYQMINRDTICTMRAQLSYQGYTCSHLSASGKATRDPSDENDEVFGKRLAQSRAMEKLLKKVAKRLRIIRNDISKELTHAEFQIKRFEDSAEKEKEHIINLLKS